MSEWRDVLLQDVCDDLTVGHVGSMAAEYISDGIPFLRSQNVRAGSLDLENVKYISSDFHNRLKKSQLKQGDIVIVRTGEPGAAALIPDTPSGLNCADLVIVRPSSLVDPRFLCYSINATARQYVAAHLVGAVQQHFNVQSARKLRLSIPSLGEQRAVSSVLESLDKKIEMNSAIASKTRALAEIEVQVAIRDGRKVIREVSSIAELVARGVTPRYSDDPAQLIVLNQKCVRNGRVSFDPSRRTREDGVPSHKRLRLNDILVNSTGVGTLGRVARWTVDYPATVDSHVTIIRIDPEKADPVCSGLALLGAQQQIESLGEGSTGQTELSRAQLAALRLAIPDADSSRRLRPVLDALEVRGASAISESITLAEIRSTLLPKLMSGRIRLRHAERIAEDVT